jgi:hypothetical protein
MKRTAIDGFCLYWLFRCLLTMDGLYDNAKLETIQGVVTEWAWRNPHCALRRCKRTGR